MLQKVIRDNVYGDILIDNEVIIDLIDTPEFQRLRRIIQLGGGQFAFTGANHNRFSHCIGVYNIVNQFLKNDSFKKMNQTQQLEVKIAGLLHDLGHGPFSHSWEKVNNRSHELYTVDIIKSKLTNINKILINYKINIDNVCQIIEGKHQNKILNFLVSSQLDADRMDYLKRDAIQANVSYASLDVNWIIRHAEVFDNKIVYPEKIVPAIEAYLLGRYHMYNQIYNHKISIAFDVMLQKIMLRIVDLGKSNHEFKNNRVKELFGDLFFDKPISLINYLQLDDYTLFEIFKTCSQENDKILIDLSNRIINRDFFSHFTDDKQEAIDSLNKSDLDQKYYCGEYTISNFEIYKVKTNTLSEKDEDIYIKDKNNLITTFPNKTKIISITTLQKQNKISFLFTKK
ncbi:HD domain-containing protein [Spiroplasma endosymbiont of Labia minor]|uniref:HD domain-containing protein n=1 Tax=Spiroplasma endosymbiont of Labia minor TaxID=3066305 RepID=UPI0030CAD7B0